MAQTHETRRAGDAAGLGKTSFPGGNDKREPFENRLGQEVVERE